MAKSNSGTKLGYVLIAEVWLYDAGICEDLPCGFTFDHEVAKNWVAKSPDRTFQVVPIIDKSEKK